MIPWGHQQCHGQTFRRPFSFESGTYSENPLAAGHDQISPRSAGGNGERDNNVCGIRHVRGALGPFDENKRRRIVEQPEFIGFGGVAEPIEIGMQRGAPWCVIGLHQGKGGRWNFEVRIAGKGPNGGTGQSRFAGAEFTFETDNVARLQQGRQFPSKGDRRLIIGKEAFHLFGDASKRAVARQVDYDAAAARFALLG